MKKYEVLKRIEEEKIVAILRMADGETAEKCFEALYKGGVTCAELPFTAPYAHTIFEAITRKFGDKMLIGAGTILDEATARIAILSGAKFLVSPSVNADVIRTGNRYGVPTLCGAATITEALAAIEAGADVVKVFPAGQFTPSVIKDWKGPVPNMEVIPMGGITLENIGAWLKAGVFACGVGGALFDGAKEGDFAKVTATAKAFKNAVENAAKSAAF